MSTINWGELVARGRAKAHGIPWNDEENHAIHNLHIPPEYVREGILTKKEYEKAVAKDEKTTADTGEKPLYKMNREELLAKAKALGIEVTPDASVASLKEVITAHLANPPKEEDENEEDDEDAQKENE